MIARLEIEHFRGLDKLVLDGLARVNLIVGANNVGKTSVLEAVYLLHEVGVDDAVQGVLRRRRYVAGDARSAVELLHTQGATEPIRFRAMSGQRVWSTELVKAEGEYIAQIHGHSSDGSASSLKTSLRAHHGSNGRLGRTPVTFFDFASLSDADVAERIGSLIVKRKRDKLVSALQRVDRRVVGIDQYKLPATSYVEAWVDLGLPELLRLTQAGHGLRYATALFAELEQNANAIALIDEIEPALHHGALESVWRAIDGVSQANQLQLFVTTHSYECLQAAHKAMAERPSDLAVFRLERQDDDRIAVFRLGPEDREAVFLYGSEVR